MGFWRRLLGREEKASGHNEFFKELLVTKSTAGVVVTPRNAMQVSAVWACVNVRSEDIAKLPVHLYRRRKDGGKERAADHPAYRLLHLAPNPRNTAFEFKQMLQMQCDLRGNAYAVKELDSRGRVSALWPIESDKVEILKVDEGKELFYRVTYEGGRQVTVPGEDMLHIRGNSFDGICGMSPITWQRETIGHAMAAEKYGAAFFGNSAQPNGALVLPTKLSPEAAAKLRADWKERFQGPENAHNLAIFDGGMDWKPIGMTNTDAQFIEARNYQNSEIWRIFRIPPHKVGDLTKATFSNIEMQAIEYVQDCLMSIMERWQQALSRDLLTEAERVDHFFEFLPDALLKGDIKSRYDAYAVGVLNGWLSSNDIRDRENMNRVDGGDQYFRPMNVVPLDAPPPEPKATEPQPPAKGKRPPKEPA
jgi:HK97 family phage portal protein